MSASSVIEREGVAGLSDGEQVAIERYDKTRTVRKWSRRGDTTPLVIESHLWRNQKRLSNFFFLFWVHPKIDKRGLARDGTPNNKSKKKCVLTKKRSASAYDDSEIVWCGKLPVWSNNTAYTVSKLLVPLGKFHRTHTKHLFVKSSDGYCMSFRVSHS